MNPKENWELLKMFKKMQNVFLKEKRNYLKFDCI